MNDEYVRIYPQSQKELSHKVHLSHHKTHYWNLAWASSIHLQSILILYSIYASSSEVVYLRLPTEIL